MRICAVILVLLTAGCTARQAPLPVLGQVPQFQLTAQNGEEFDSSKILDGKVWVADFIFTNCSSACPRMSTQMRQLQSRLAGKPEVKLVSFTVDPKRDTPEALAAYARRFHAKPGQWYFLTGEQSRLHALAFDAFKLSSVDGSLNHSTRLVLLDGRSRIRGYYDTEQDDGAATRLAAHIERLLREKS